MFTGVAMAAKGFLPRDGRVSRLGSLRGLDHSRWTPSTEAGLQSQNTPGTRQACAWVSARKALKRHSPPSSSKWLPCRKMGTVLPNLLIIQEKWELWITGTLSQLFLLLAKKANNTFF